jgi:ribokinase
MTAGRPRVAVVGHVEWVRFARVAHVPRAGEVTHAREPFEEPAGGGAVAAVQLARLAGSSMLVTALGEDDPGRRSAARLRELGVDVRAARRTQPTRSAVTLVDDARERTITTFGERLEPTATDAELPWDAFGELDAVYFTAGDVRALRAARAARVLVASPRAADALGQGVALDALVLSADDAIEREAARRAQEDAALVVSTRGARGGSYWERGAAQDESTARTSTAHGDAEGGGTEGTWAASPPPGPIVDSYGCGDSFAAGLTYGLGAGLTVAAALELAARCGAACLTGRGPYERQMPQPPPSR